MRKKNRFLRIMKVLARNMPLWSLCILVVMVLQGILPALNVYLVGRFTKLLVEGQFVVDRAAAICAALVAGSFCFDALCSECNHLIRMQASFHMEYRLRKDVIEQVEKLDIRFKEQSQYQAIVSRANQAVSPTEMFSFLDMASSIVSAVISVAGVVALLVRVNPLIPLFNLVTLLLEAFFMRRYAERMNAVYERVNEDERKAATISSWFVSAGSNAEMRVFRSLTWFRDLWRDTFRRVSHVKNKDITRIEMEQGLANLPLVALPLISLLIYLLMGGTEGSGAAEDVVNIFNSCNVMTMSVMMLIGVAGMLSEKLVDFENYFRLFDVDAPHVRGEGEASPGAAISLQNVSFRYDEGDPGSRPAVKDVSLRLESGKVYAIVGENGSGKTTLSKLIMQLYRPSEGSVDMFNSSGEKTVLRTTAALQDFVRYDLSLKDNIVIGDFAREDDAEAYRKAIMDSASGDLAKKVGEDSVLGTRFGDVNLSGGEWQRLAVARGFFRRDCPLVVFDEPDASLDALAEAKIIKNMAQNYKDSICIFITHRLASVKYADWILVMQDGEVVEQGTHDELTAGPTKYREMFAAQIEWYQ